MEIKKIALFVLMAVSGCVATNTFRENRQPLKNGIYFGQVGGFYPPNKAYLLIGKSISIEIYQTIKGQILEVEKDILDSYGAVGGAIYQGKKTCVLWEGSNLVLRQLSIPGKVNVPDIPLKYFPEKEPELNEYRDRAYLHRDFYIQIKELRDF